MRGCRRGLCGAAGELYAELRANVVRPCWLIKPFHVRRRGLEATELGGGLEARGVLIRGHHRVARRRYTGTLRQM